MTLVLIKVKEGLVLAADSRRNFPSGRPPIDDSIKLFPFKNHNHKHVAVLVSGAAIIVEWDDCAPNELLPKLETKLPSERLSISDCAEQLHKCFEACYKNECESSKRPEMENRLTSNPQTTFHVAGFDENEKEGRVFKLVLNLRVARSNIPPPELRIIPVDEGEILKGNTCGIACGGNCNIFEKVYEEYFSDNKDLIQKPRNPDGTCRIPDKTSLQEAKTHICSLMGRAIYSQRDLKNAESGGGKICACTITPDDGLKMFDCDDFP